jgi:hypothetical protein
MCVSMLPLDQVQPYAVYLGMAAILEPVPSAI